MPVITRSIASMSWIDPKTGLPEVDAGGNPGSTTTRAVIVGEAAYRFSNFLEAEIDIDKDGKAITGSRFTAASGMYRSPSFMRIPSAPVGKIGRVIDADATAVTFRQIVGCRTVSPETIGTVGGALAGIGGGVAIGVFVVGTGGWGLLALGAGGLLVGGGTGKEIAEYASAFPPIWTELELTIRVDGTTNERLIASSLFPSCTFYRESPAGKQSYAAVSNYEAVSALERWKANGWGDAASQRAGPTGGNPWNMVSGARKLGGHIINRPCPTGYKCE